MCQNKSLGRAIGANIGPAIMTGLVTGNPVHGLLTTGASVIGGGALLAYEQSTGNS